MNSWRQTLKVYSGYANDALKQGLVSLDDLNKLKDIDPSPNKKYLNWLVKIYIKEHPSIDDLRNYLEEYNTAVSRNLSDTKDIYALKTFEDLKKIVDAANDRASASLRDLESDYDVIRDDADVFIAVPYTHEASRKLGLTELACREDKDSAWCTTYKNAGHFNSYFFNQQITFYYVRVKSPVLVKELQRTIKSYDCRGVAILVYKDGKIEAYDAADKLMSKPAITAFRKIIGI